MKSLEDVIARVRSGGPSFYFSSQTSTVIPYDRLEKIFGDVPVQLVNLSAIPPEMEMEGDELVCRGGVTWQGAKEFCLEHGREVMTSPTEELACVLAGVATSCTGERCFGYGTLRDQVRALTVVGQGGEVRHLRADVELAGQAPFRKTEEKKLLADYQGAWKRYSGFKNAPFPRLERETDLMIGLEGQLGVVVEARLRTLPRRGVRYLFFKLPRWERDSTAHLEILRAVVPLRKLVSCCELIDGNSLEFIPREERALEGVDLIFLEVLEESFEEVFEHLTGELDSVDAEDIFEMSSGQFRHLRMAVPRGVVESNAKRRVIKQGTDIQVRAEQMPRLLGLYRELAGQGIAYNLFGHFGDCHLHFNFMPTTDQVSRCQGHLEDLYREVQKMGGSPFVEHGIGTIKQKFIRPFLGDVQLKMFRHLKERMDDKNIFFPQGYLNL